MEAGLQHWSSGSAEGRPTLSSMAQRLASMLQSLPEWVAILQTPSQILFQVSKAWRHVAPSSAMGTLEESLVVIASLLDTASKRVSELLHECVERADRSHCLEAWVQCLRIWVDFNHVLNVRSLLSPRIRMSTCFQYMSCEHGDLDDAFSSVSAFLMCTVVRRTGPRMSAQPKRLQKYTPVISLVPCRRSW